LHDRRKSQKPRGVRTSAHDSHAPHLVVLAGPLGVSHSSGGMPSLASACSNALRHDDQRLWVAACITIGKLWQIAVLAPRSSEEVRARLWLVSCATVASAMAEEYLRRYLGNIILRRAVPVMRHHTLGERCTFSDRARPHDDTNTQSDRQRRAQETTARASEEGSTGLVRATRLLPRSCITSLA